MTDATDDRSPNPVDLHVGARVRMRRRLRGVSQEKLAESLGLTFQQVQKYERGANRISASKLYEIAASLQTPVGYFFEGLADPSALDSAAEGVSACPIMPRMPETLTINPCSALIRNNPFCGILKGDPIFLSGIHPPN